jgi:hypothetical protein
MEIGRKRKDETQKEYEERQWWYKYLNDNPEIHEKLLRLQKAGCLHDALSEIETRYNLRLIKNIAEVESEIDVLKGYNPVLPNNNVRS